MTRPRCRRRRRGPLGAAKRAGFEGIQAALSSKSWMASPTVWEPHPGEQAICEARSPLSLARMIWARPITKASVEGSAVFSCSFSVSESERTKIGGCMAPTITLHTSPVLDVQ